MENRIVEQNDSIEENNIFTGSRNKIVWEACLVHEKRLKVLDKHISNLLDKVGNINLSLMERKINQLNKKISAIEVFKSSYNNYKKKVDDIKTLMDIQDSSDIDEKLETLDNEKLNKDVYLTSFKTLKKNIEKIEKDMLKITDDLDILKLNNNNDNDDNE